ncbi:MAG TPA: hypothetical protein VFA29_08060 [Candidatus Baltobacteraceae bacterium]|nr:hypothetical protein [Candidatus Baltobacteraceae bacterium]
MLRIAVAAFGVLLFVAGATLLAAGRAVLRPFGIQLLIFGALVLLGIVFERRYRGATASGAALQQTGERFVDPTSGKLTEVLYDPKTGERVYREVTNS